VRRDRALWSSEREREMPSLDLCERESSCELRDEIERELRRSKLPLAQGPENYLTTLGLMYAVFPCISV
jgi:hypothetical protein